MDPSFGSAQGAQDVEMIDAPGLAPALPTNAADPGNALGGPSAHIPTTPSPPPTSPSSAMYYSPMPSPASPARSWSVASATPGTITARVIIIRFKVQEWYASPPAAAAAGARPLQHLEAVCPNARALLAAEAGASSAPGATTTDADPVLTQLGLDALRINCAQDYLLAVDLHSALAWLFANQDSTGSYAAFLDLALSQFPVLRWVVGFANVVVPVGMAVAHVLVRDVAGVDPRRGYGFHREMPREEEGGYLCEGMEGWKRADEDRLRFLGVFGHGEVSKTERLLLFCGALVEDVHTREGEQVGDLVEVELADVTAKEMKQLLNGALWEVDNSHRAAAKPGEMGRTDHQSILASNAVWGGEVFGEQPEEIVVRDGDWVPAEEWKSAQEWWAYVPTLRLVHRPGQYL